MKPKTKLLFFAFLAFCFYAKAQKTKANKSPYVIAYYTGNAEYIDSIPAQKLTHIIFSFVGMQENRLTIVNANDSLRIKKLVGLKKKNPGLKIMVALGGWGGCKTCSMNFSSPDNRETFAKSTKKLLDDFDLDGFDLDWEYPTIEGFPGYRYTPEDKDNFTNVFKKLRKAVGRKKTLSFAAGGFNTYLKDAVDWKAVMKYVDFTNLMTYDLMNGNSVVTGHQTPLLSGGKTVESTDNAVQYLLKLGIASRQLVVGAAFYARTWKNVSPENNGLYNSGKFEHFIGYRYFEKRLNSKDGFVYYWDETTQSPYAYNHQTKSFATFDDSRSVKEKTNYVIQQNLGGIMFWELSLDKRNGGLVDAINKTIATIR